MKTTSPISLNINPNTVGARNGNGMFERRESDYEDGGQVPAL